MFRSIIDCFYINYRHNSDACVLVDERHVLGVMPRPQRPQGGAHVSAQPDRGRQLQDKHRHRWHLTDQVLLRVSGGKVKSVGSGGGGGVCVNMTFLNIPLSLIIPPPFVIAKLVKFQKLIHLPQSDLYEPNFLTHTNKVWRSFVFPGTVISRTLWGVCGDYTAPVGIRWR